MRARTVIRHLCDAFGVTRRELEHSLSCPSCELDGDGQLRLCREALTRYRGVTFPPPGPPTPESQLIQQIWSKELLHQLSLVLRFGEPARDADSG